jgi:hypothetical protein
MVLTDDIVIIPGYAGIPEVRSPSGFETMEQIKSPIVTVIFLFQTKSDDF